MTGLVTIVGVLGAVAFVAASAATDPASVDLAVFGTLALAAALAQRYRVVLFADVSMSVSFGVTMAGLVLLGAGPAVWLNLVAAAVVAVTMKRKAPHRIIFNAGNLAISAYLAAAAFDLTGAAAHPGSVPWIVLGSAAAGAIAFASSTALVSLAITLETREPFHMVWRRNYGWTTLNFMAVAVNGGAVGVAASTFGPTALVVSVLPFGIAWYTYRLYMGKSAEVHLQNDALRLSASELASSNYRLRESNASIVGALLGSLEAKDHYTTGHCASTALHAAAIASAMGMSAREIAAVELGALFHDVGKIGIPEEILRKTGPLTTEEWKIMRTHPSIGASILERVPALANVMPVVLAHHERFDGSGYPAGLKGDEIPLAARIVAVADAYHAMTSTRTYRVALSRERAMWELEANAGTQFDPSVVGAFIGILARDPQAAPVNDHVQMYEKAFAAVRWVA